MKSLQTGIYGRENVLVKKAHTHKLVLSPRFEDGNDVQLCQGSSACVCGVHCLGASSPLGQPRETRRKGELSVWTCWSLDEERLPGSTDELIEGRTEVGPPSTARQQERMMSSLACTMMRIQVGKEHPGSCRDTSDILCPAWKRASDLPGSGFDQAWNTGKRCSGCTAPSKAVSAGRPMSDRSLAQADMSTRGVVIFFNSHPTIQPPSVPPGPCSGCEIQLGNCVWLNLDAAQTRAPQMTYAALRICSFSTQS